MQPVEGIIKVFWSSALGTTQNFFFIYILDFLLAKWFRLNFFLMLWHQPSLASLSRTFCMGATIVTCNYVIVFMCILFTAFRRLLQLYILMIWAILLVLGIFLSPISERFFMVWTLVVSSSIDDPVWDLLILRFTVLKSLIIDYERRGLIIFLRRRCFIV